jgi:hypothetical protein
MPFYLNKKMSESTLNILAIAIASGALLTSFIFSWITLRMTVRQSKSNTYSDIMSRLFEMNRLEIERPDLFGALYDDFNPEAVRMGGGTSGLGHYLYMLFNLYEEIFTQNDQYKLLGDNQFDQWVSRIENDFTLKPFLRDYWKHVNQESPNIYSLAFRIFIEKRLSAIPAEAR